MNMNFVPIKGEIIEVAEEYLQNNDLHLLYYARLLVITGAKEAADWLINYFYHSPGKIHKARWVTLATNLLFLWMQDLTPTENLRLLVTYVVNVYCPSMFYTKINWHCSNGPRHFFYLAELNRKFLQKDHPIYYQSILKTLKGNSYYIHPESVLVGMVHDTDPKVKEKAIEIISNLRAQDK